MSKLPNIIQRRELEPVLVKALKVVKHYEKAANCAASVTGPDWDSAADHFYSICRQCKKTKSEKNCSCLHMEAISKARQLGGSYIYVCPGNLVFWTSPFYSGERYAGSLFSGGVQSTEENSGKVKALANMMLICADQISGLSFVQKSIKSRLKKPNDAEFHFKTQKKQPANEKSGENDACSTDMERMMLACLRRGDNVEGRKILLSLLHTQHLEFNQNFPAFRLKAMELAVLLSRAAADLDEKDETILEASSRCLKKIEESTKFEEIAEILALITENMSGKIFSFHGVRHFSALRKAERYIWENYTRKISLKEIAGASGLSAPYFSTIFKEEMGENLSNYLNRMRVEKAASMLLTSDLPISEVAAACGFEDQSWFSKIFRNNTGLTPGKYREQGNMLG
jgi:AraC-like DNA-binding protein/ligand-binding sensor protein